MRLATAKKAGEGSGTVTVGEATEGRAVAVDEIMGETRVCCRGLGRLSALGFCWGENGEMAVALPPSMRPSGRNAVDETARSPQGRCPEQGRGSHHLGHRGRTATGSRRGKGHGTSAGTLPPKRLWDDRRGTFAGRPRVQRRCASPQTVTERARVATVWEGHEAAATDTVTERSRLRVAVAAVDKICGMLQRLRLLQRCIFYCCSSSLLLQLLLLKPLSASVAPASAALVRCQSLPCQLLQLQVLPPQLLLLLASSCRQLPSSLPSAGCGLQATGLQLLAASALLPAF